ncbi:hypothetical protein NQZ68_040471 [Dissostichus eleginoides]|nr:hypothetical protein NQZ68_040471 [Dissostichus eleginoides]
MVFNFDKVFLCSASDVPNTKRRLPAASAHLPQKRKQTSVARPSKPADLPPVSNVAPSPQTSTAPMHLEDPQRIRSVEDFQPIYHRAMEAMLSLVLGRPIKQKLWEQLLMKTVCLCPAGLESSALQHGCFGEEEYPNQEVQYQMFQIHHQNKPRRDS